MSDSPSQSQSDELSEQLKAAQQTQRKLLGIIETHQSQIRSLSDCISQLSQSFKGQDLDLDVRLTKLRSQLSGEINSQSLLPEMAEISRMLHDRNTRTHRELQTSQDSMTALTRHLVAIDSIPDHTQRELSFFQQELAKPSYSIWDHLPRMNRLMQLFEELLLAKLVKNEPVPATAMHQQLAHELAHMLSDLEFGADNRDTIAALKAELAGKISVERLLQAYQQTLKLLTREIVREKNSSHQFLSAINDCLSVVREAINDNWSISVRNFGNQRETNRQLSAHYDVIDNQVRNATDLEQLKAHISEEISSLRQMLLQREREQHSDLLQLKHSMDSMRKELNSLSTETNGYKEKLVEQQRLNMVDTLTQLPNRTALDERLKREYRNVRRYGSNLWVAVADIDHFKRVNDSYGHSTGDKTLQVIAMALKNSLRKEEFVARYGGEEFVLLLPEVNPEQVLQILNRTREKIAAIPFKFRSDRLNISVSIGAALVGENETIQETFERADAALYKAKRNGRNRVELDV